MNEPKPFYWDYDRNLWDSSDLAATFSVGVYQWLPTSSGKGLKKSKTIRVSGYTAEPLRVYAKAQELCDRLNAEQARAENLPAWLRKQYSVPKPVNEVREADTREPASRELTGAQVRATRLKVMEQWLLPQGFVKGRDSVYVREQGEQIHLIDFQADTAGHRYTVNLGFHYGFVPPYSLGGEGAAATYCLLDCALSARLGYFGPEGRDVWHEYGEDRDRLAATLEQNAREALAVFERYGRRWQDPEWWLSTVAHNWPDREEILWVGNWHVRWPELLAGATAVHLGQWAAAKELLAQLLEGAESPHIVQAGRALLKRVPRL